jgi:hypothetical protein
MRVSGLRLSVAALGALLCAGAAYKLGVAIDLAVSEGNVLVANPLPRSSRKGLPQVYAVPWRDAWSYLAGWLSLGVSGGSLLASAYRSSIGLFLLAIPLTFLAFVLVAATLTLNSWSGVFLFLGVWFVGVFCLLAVTQAEKWVRFKLAQRQAKKLGLKQ